MLQPGFSEQSLRHERPSPPATELLPNPTKRQKRILSALGSIDDLAQRLHGHLLESYRSGNLTPGQSTELEEGKFIKGELAEILVTSEFSLFPVKHGGGVVVALPSSTNAETNKNVCSVFSMTRQ